MPEWPSLEVSLRHRIGALALHVDFHLTKPWTVLFAPSGAGKTTVLRAIAGLMHTEHARIVWTLPDQDSQSGAVRRSPLAVAHLGEKSFTPPHRRRLPMVTQKSALFPHFTVRQNICYGFRGRQDARRLMLALLELCRIEHLGHKMPSELSGGEQQRVALARALGADGLGVLLDEPFAGIDGSLKDVLMRDTKAWLAAKHIPVLHVTHDVGEVFAVADEVIQLQGGRVVRQGLPEVVLREEKERLLGWLGPSL